MDTQKIIAEIDAEISRLQQVKALLIGTNAAKGRQSGRNSMAGSSGKKRTMSAEARERIAAAQRARWAKSKKAMKNRAARNSSTVPARKKTTTAKYAVKSAKKRTVSPEARARMVAGQKARWAKARKAGQKVSRGARNSPAPAKGARKSIPAKKARSTKSANATNTKAPVAPAAPSTPAAVVS